MTRTLEAKGLGFTYEGAHSRSLRGLDLSVGEGRLALLAGPSGGGKSTAALGLAGLLGHAVTGRVEGSVSLGGRGILGGDGGDSEARGRPGDVALVQQDPDAHLCTLTVQDEVAFGPENLCLPPEEVLRRVDDALATVGARHLLGRSTTELSGGERQRVAIASMLAMRPRALVLDEPTANLDWGARGALLRTLVRLPGQLDAPVVVAEHRLDVLWGAADEVVALDGGATRWRGSPSDGASQAEGLAMSGVRVPGRPDLLGLRRPRCRAGDVVLRARGLVAGHGEREVLRGVDLEMRTGEVLALVGPNGGGKTTLLRCAMGLHVPADGALEVGGVDALGVPASTIARRAGLVFQSPDHQLFCPTVREELGFGPRNLGLHGDAVRGRLEGIAASYRLDGLLRVHPFRLSHGQKRRLNIASVEACSPRLIMLDEPFIGQDVRSLRAINDRLQDAKERGAGILVVSHDLEALSAMSDRAVELVDGVAREVGDVEGLELAAARWGEGR